jgi:multiple sugar transport system substrate-binding protein
MNRLSLCLAALLAALVGCGEQRDTSPSGKTVLDLWHSQKQQNEEALKEIVARFNEQSADYEVRLHNLGSYTTLFQKARTTIQGGQLPDLCVAYPSMVAEFMEADAVLALDDYLKHPDTGLSEAERGDIFPTFLAVNRYPEFGNRLLSFPFTKSLLMLYYNADILRAAGHETLPATWSAFIQQCRDVKAKTDKMPFAYARDPSSYDGMVMSLGGTLVSEDGTDARLDSPEAGRAFEILHTLVSEGLATVVPVASDDDRLHFSTGRCAFILRSSTTRAYMREDIQDAAGRDRFDWQMACPPVGEGQPKLTVLYGGNICIFKSTPERQRGAWEFIRYFISPAVTAEWAVRTGYLPVRRSAAEQPVYAEFLAEHPRNRTTFETIPHGVREPSVAGWQAIRQDILAMLTRVCKGQIAPQAAAAELDEQADAELERRARRAERWEK